MVDDAALDSLETIYYAGGDTPKPDVNPNYPRLYMHTFDLQSQIACNLMSLNGVQFQKL